MKKHTILALFFTLSLILTSVPINVYADEADGEIEEEIEDDALSEDDESSDDMTEDDDTNDTFMLNSEEDEGTDEDNPYTEDNITSINIDAKGVLYENWDNLHTDVELDDDIEEHRYFPLKYLDMTVIYNNGDKKKICSWLDRDASEDGDYIGDAVVYSYSSMDDDGTIQCDCRWNGTNGDDIAGELILETGQTKNNPWSVGAHTVTARMGNAYTTYQIEVVESPVISIVPKQEVVNVVKTTDEYWKNDFETDVVIKLKDGTIIDTEKDTQSGSVAQLTGDEIVSSKFVDSWNGVDV